MNRTKGPLIAGSSLPRFVRMKASVAQHVKTTSTVGQKEDGSLHCFDDNAEPHPKHQEFELQLAKDGSGRFSIKSCYTNKYMALEQPNSLILAMEAAQPNENTSRWSCTLFEATANPNRSIKGDDLSIQLWFVHSNKLVCMFLQIGKNGFGKLVAIDEHNHINPPGLRFVGPCFFTIVDCEKERERQDKKMSVPVSSLPQLVKLEDTSGWGLVQYEKYGPSLVRFPGDDLTSWPHVFQLERAKTGKGLCHIKSTFNNKYWGLAKGPESDTIRLLGAVATEPNEDKSERSCTLFRLLRTETDSTLIHLLFVHSHVFVCFYGESLGVQREGEIPEAAIFKVKDGEAVPPPQKHFYDSFRYVVLKSNFNDKYLRQTNKIDNGFANGSVKVDGDDPLSPNCKFELERPHDDDKGLCRIRSCYNNKYLTMKGTGIIKAVATKPKPDDPEKDGGSSTLQVEEDKMLLFQLVQAKQAIQLRFVYSQGKKGLVAYSDFTNSLYVSPEEEEDDLRSTQTTLDVFDWEKFVVLPKLVAFKGDNFKYLAVHNADHGDAYLSFDGDNIGDKVVAHEIIYSRDRLSVRIKNTESKKFWDMNNDGYIQLTSEDTKEGTLFEPIKIAGGKGFVLRSFGNHKLCRRDSGNSRMYANADSFSDFTHITIEETVSKRIISYISYRLDEARIYDETIKTMVTREASNHNSEKETVQLKLLYQQKASHTLNGSESTWDSSEDSISVGFTFVKLPLQLGYESKGSSGSDKSHGWGDTTESTTDVETTHVVTVPENSRVQVRLIATEGKCDIPFSYVVHDTLFNGDTITREVDGGMYTGVGNYNFQYITKKLPPLDDDGFSKDTGTQGTPVKP